MKVLIVLLLVISASDLFAQTKLIAHRSHSGSDASFTLAAAGNFGLDPGHSRRFKLDTLRAIDTSQQAPAAIEVTPEPAVSPMPIPNSGPASTILPERPAQPDTLKNGQPENNSGTPGTEPKISNGQEKKSQGPTDGVSQVVPSASGNAHASLLWLALALAVPATGSVVVGMKRRDRSIG